MLSSKPRQRCPTAMECRNNYMGKKPKIRSISIRQRISQLHWGVKIATAAFAFFVAMGSAAATWDSFGWWKPASVWYVNEKVKPLSAIQLDLANGKRESTENDLAKWQLELTKTKDPVSLEIIHKQINTLSSTRDKLDKQIETLEKRQ